LEWYFKYLQYITSTWGPFTIDTTEQGLSVLKLLRKLGGGIDGNEIFRLNKEIFDRERDWAVGGLMWGGKGEVGWGVTEEEDDEDDDWDGEVEEDEEERERVDDLVVEVERLRSVLGVLSRKMEGLGRVERSIGSMRKAAVTSDWRRGRLSRRNSPY